MRDHYYKAWKPEITSELRWLRSRGERDFRDVLTDERGKHVLMGDGRYGYKKVYLPEQFQLIKTQAE